MLVSLFSITFVLISFLTPIHAGVVEFIPEIAIGLGGARFLTFSIPEGMTEPLQIGAPASATGNVNICSLIRAMDPNVDLFPNALANVTTAQHTCFPTLPNFSPQERPDYIALSVQDPIGYLVWAPFDQCMHSNLYGDWNAAATLYLMKDLPVGSFISCFIYLGVHPVSSDRSILAPNFLSIKGHSISPPGFQSIYHNPLFHYHLLNKGLLKWTATTRTDLIAVIITQATGGSHDFVIIPSEEYAYLSSSLSFDTLYRYPTSTGSIDGYYCYRQSDIEYTPDTFTQYTSLDIGFVTYTLNHNATRMGRIFYNPASNQSKIHIIASQFLSLEPIHCLLPIRTVLTKHSYHVLIGPQFALTSDSQNVIYVRPNPSLRFDRRLSVNYENPDAIFRSLADSFPNFSGIILRNSSLFTSFFSDNSSQSTHDTSHLASEYAVLRSDAGLYDDLPFIGHSSRQIDPIFQGNHFTRFKKSAAFIPPNVRYTELLAQHDITEKQTHHVSFIPSSTSQFNTMSFNQTNSFSIQDSTSPSQLVNILVRYPFLFHRNTNQFTRYRLFLSKFTLPEPSYSLNLSYSITSVSASTSTSTSTSTSSIESKSSSPIPTSKSLVFFHDITSVEITLIDKPQTTISDYLVSISSTTNKVKITPYAKAHPRYQLNSKNNSFLNSLYTFLDHEYHWILRYADLEHLPITSSSIDTFRINFTPTDPLPDYSITMINSTHLLFHAIYQRLSVAELEFTIGHINSEFSALYTQSNLSTKIAAVIAPPLKQEKFTVTFNPLILVSTLQVSMIPTAIKLADLTNVDPIFTHTQAVLDFTLKTTQFDGANDAPSNKTINSFLSSINNNQTIKEDIPHDSHGGAEFELIDVSSKNEKENIAEDSEHPHLYTIGSILDSINVNSPPSQSKFSSRHLKNQTHQQNNKKNQKFDATQSDSTILPENDPDPIKTHNLRNMYSQDPRTATGKQQLIYAHKLKFSTTISFPTISGTTSIQAAFSISKPLQFFHVAPQCSISLRNGIYNPIAKPTKIQNPFFNNYTTEYQQVLKDARQRYSAQNFATWSPQDRVRIAALHQDLLLSPIYNDYGNYFFNSDNFTIPVENHINTYVNIAGLTPPYDFADKTIKIDQTENNVFYSLHDGSDLLTSRSLNYLFDLYQTTAIVTCEFYVDNYSMNGALTNLEVYLRTQQMPNWIHRSFQILPKPPTTPFQDKLQIIQEYQSRMTVHQLVSWVIGSPYSINSVEDLQNWIQKVLKTLTTTQVHHSHLVIDPDTKFIKKEWATSTILDANTHPLSFDDISLFTDTPLTLFSRAPSSIRSPYFSADASDTVSTGSLISLVFNLTSYKKQVLVDLSLSDNWVINADEFRFFRGHADYIYPMCTISDWINSSSLELITSTYTNERKNMKVTTDPIDPTTPVSDFLIFHKHPFDHAICGPTPMFGRSCDIHSQCQNSICFQGKCLSTSENQQLMNKRQATNIRSATINLGEMTNVKESLNNVPLENYFQSLEFYPENDGSSLSLICLLISSFFSLWFFM